MIRAAVVLVAALGFAACSKGPEHPYPAELVDAFVTSCSQKAPKKSCLCAIDKIQRAFTEAEFRDIDARMGRGEPPPKTIVDAVSDCRDQ